MVGNKKLPAPVRPHHAPSLSAGRLVDAPPPRGRGQCPLSSLELRRSLFDKGAPEEIKAAFEGYGAYFGTYEIHEAEGFVIHHVEGSLFPNNVGTEQKRFFEFSGDKLILKPPPRQVGGAQVAPRITWQRVKEIDRGKR